MCKSQFQTLALFIFSFAFIGQSDSADNSKRIEVTDAVWVKWIFLRQRTQHNEAQNNLLIVDPPWAVIVYCNFSEKFHQTETSLLKAARARVVSY